MIDYDKIKTVYELIDKFNEISEETILIEITYWPSHDKKFQYEFRDLLKNNIFYRGTDIDELIVKLQELTKPEPKYKDGDEVWCVAGGEPHQYFYNECMTDSKMFPTRQALIEHQIKYWSKLKQECC